MSVAERLLADSPGAGVHVELHPEVQSMEAVANLIGERSGAVLRYRGSSLHAKEVDHWVCAVACAGPPVRLEVACSIRWSDVYRLTDDLYEEEDVSFGRRSNDLLAEPDAEVVRGCVLRVARSENLPSR